MHWINITGIAVGLAMDAFAVSVTNGLRAGKQLRARYACKTAGCFGLFQAIMPIAGWLAGIGLRERIMQFDHWIAFFLLSFIGIHMIMETVREPHPDRSWDTKSQLISNRTLIALAIATSIDALAVGVTLAFTDTPHFYALLADAALIGGVTFLICLTGVYIGSRFGSALEQKAGIIGGILLILMGVKILLEHLLHP